MHSVKRVVKTRFIPRGYIDDGEGASITQDDTGSVISDNADYPDDKSELEYYSEYEEEFDDSISEVSEQETTPDYKNLENILTEEDDFAEIKF